MEVRGKAIIFGDDVNTDVIIPSKYLTTLDPNELAKHAMEGLDPTFYEKARRGVIVVAGKNFGCGSSREHAPIALKHAGVRCVIAKSFARIFFRNAINIGLPVVECVSILEKISNDDDLLVNLADGEIVDLTKNLRLQASKLPSFILEIIAAGGLVEHLKRRLEVHGKL
ncbi:MAG: 3-isopropylmalate dehydratase small subunit [Candidatus Bathyarchaeia archaeon]